MIAARTHHGARALAGALLYVDDARGAAMGEVVAIPQAGQAPRRGQVIDAGTGATVMQLLEDPIGLAPARVAITLTGATSEATVGRELLAAR